MSNETLNFREFIESKLTPEEIAQIEAKVAEMVKDEEEPLTAVELFQSMTNSIIQDKAEKAAQHKLAREQYIKYIGDLKKKLKSHSKNQLVEMIGSQAWQFNHLQQMARQLHEENDILKKHLKPEQRPEGESNV